MSKYCVCTIAAVLHLLCSSQGQGEGEAYYTTLLASVTSSINNQSQSATLSTSQRRAAQYLQMFLQTAILQGHYHRGQGQGRSRRAIIKPSKRYWPDGVMPYELDEELGMID